MIEKNRESAIDLTKRMAKLVDGEQSSDVVAACIAVMVDALKQSKIEDRRKAIPEFKKFFNNLMERLQ